MSRIDDQSNSPLYDQASALLIHHSPSKIDPLICSCKPLLACGAIFSNYLITMIHSKLFTPILALGFALNASAAPKNFIVVMSDDQGYNDLSCFG
jgi:hypothetical protein